MARNSLFDRYEAFVASAVIGAHANTLNQGFRQYDVRFLLEIFTNWVECSEASASLPIQNTQVSRYLETMVKDGFARKLAKEGRPLYRLTRVGLLELISRIVEQDHFHAKEHFFFALCIVRSYRSRLTALVKNEGKRFPYSLQVELESLLDPVNFIDRQLDRAKRELRKLNKRIEAVLAGGDLAQDLAGKGRGIAEIASEVERFYPFGVNTERRYSEVFSQGTERQLLWEMTEGNKVRSQFLWEPSVRQLGLFFDQLSSLKAQLVNEESAER